MGEERAGLVAQGLEEGIGAGVREGETTVIPEILSYRCTPRHLKVYMDLPLGNSNS